MPASPRAAPALTPARLAFPMSQIHSPVLTTPPMSALAGLVTEVNANYNLTKTLSALPEGSVVPRRFRDNELESGQDTGA